MAILFTIVANAKRHYLEPFAYVRDLLVKMSSLCAACGVDIPDFTDASNLTGTEFRELGKSLASQLPEEALTALLPDQWAAGNPKKVLVHRIEEARQVANRTRDDRQNAAKKSQQLNSAPPKPLATERRPNKWVPRTLTTPQQVTLKSRLSNWIILILAKCHASQGGGHRRCGIGSFPGQHLQHPCARLRDDNRFLF